MYLGIIFECVGIIGENGLVSPICFNQPSQVPTSKSWPDSCRTHSDRA